MRVRLAALAAIGIVSLLLPAGAGTRTARRHAAPKLTRYSVVHGCYALRLTSGRLLGPFRMQAATLGEYLLYDGSYLGAGLTRVGTPDASTVWRLDGHFTLTNLASGEKVPVSFVRAGGCPTYPEGAVDATGTAFRGTDPAGGVTGTIDAHTHVTAFDFLGGDWHCGRPWDEFGIQYALPDCAPYEQGTNGQVESFVDYGTPSHKHDTVGWPTFHDWPSPTALAEEGDYYTGIERAWKAGLRVMVTQLVDNEALCELMTKRRNPCNDMAAVHIQARDLRALQDYVDAQFGGPGKGFFRIVTNPFQARQVVNSGKLAVVEGIEVSRVLGCGEYLGVPQCDRNQIDAGLREIRALGVSTFFPIHKFDNAFGGTKMDGGETGVLVNGGNHLETGSFWDIKTCTGPEHDNTQLTTLPTGAFAQLLDGPVATVFGGAPLPTYPPPPHCNQRGLTDLGAYLINKMVQQHFTVELDHMDAKTADQVLTILEGHHYSGVVSAHSWDSPQENPRIYDLGGFVTPIAGASPQSFIDQWRTSLLIRNKRFYNGTGFGYGADMNGLAEQSQPTSGHPISYPFKSYDGRVTFSREVWGQRAFDLNRDGVANYGMYPDWLQELQTLAGHPILDDMFHGAEAYLEMWERAYGVPGESCLGLRGRVSRRGIGPARLGQSFESLLYAAGQPLARPGRAYRYCVSGGGTLSVVFDRRGRVAMVLTNAPYRLAKRLRGRLVRVRSGDVRWVGVTRARGRALRADLLAAGL